MVDVLGPPNSLYDPPMPGDTAPQDFSAVPPGSFASQVLGPPSSLAPEPVSAASPASSSTVSSLLADAVTAATKVYTASRAASNANATSAAATAHARAVAAQLDAATKATKADTARLGGGKSSMPSWVLPVVGIAAIGALFFFLKKR